MSGLKQTDIANRFGVDQSDVSRIFSKHRQTGNTKDRPPSRKIQQNKCARRQGSGSDVNTEQDQFQLSACQEVGASSPYSTVQIYSQSSAIYRRQSQQTTQKTSCTDCRAQKGMCAKGPTIGPEKRTNLEPTFGVMNLDSVSTMLMGASVSGDDVAKIAIETVLSQGHMHLDGL